MRFVVIGGGCYGSYYARQLIRAADTGAIEQPEITVVDHSMGPQVSRDVIDPRVTVIRADWHAFFDDYFAGLRDDTDDQIVPPPFTPHLALSWLLRALGTSSTVAWSIVPFRSLPQTPFVHHSDNGTLNVSHADWICPVHCIEPETCPHTRGPRSWDMAETARAFAKTMWASGQAVDQVHLFQCLHFTHGVGTYPAAAVKRAFCEIRSLSAKAGQPLQVLVGTVSHCHGTMHLLQGVDGTDTVSR